MREDPIQFLFDELNDLEEFEKGFYNETDCTDFLLNLWLSRGSNICPFCDDESIFYFLNKKRKPNMMRCSSCRKDFTWKTRTMFEHSKISLLTWFHFLFLEIHMPDLDSKTKSQKLGITPQTNNLMKRRWHEYLMKNSDKF